MIVWLVSCLIYLNEKIFKNLTDLIFWKKNPFKNDNSRRIVIIPIREEPNQNYSCEEADPSVKYFAVFVDHKGKTKCTFDITGHTINVRAYITYLDLRLRFYNYKIDNWQEKLNKNRLLSTSPMEKCNHQYKKDLACIRKLESLVLKHDPSFVRRPEYPGEERDDVNSY